MQKPIVMWKTEREAGKKRVWQDNQRESNSALRHTNDEQTMHKPSRLLHTNKYCNLCQTMPQCFLYFLLSNFSVSIRWVFFFFCSLGCSLALIHFWLLNEKLKYNFVRLLFFFFFWYGWFYFPLLISNKMKYNWSGELGTSQQLRTINGNRIEINANKTSNEFHLGNDSQSNVNNNDEHNNNGKKKKENHHWNWIS